MGLLKVLEEVFEASGCTVKRRADVTGASGNTYLVPLHASRGNRLIIVDVVNGRPVTEKDVARLADVARDTNAVGCLVGIDGFTDESRAACAAAEIESWDRPMLEREIGRAVLTRALEADDPAPEPPGITVRPVPAFAPAPTATLPTTAPPPVAVASPPPPPAPPTPVSVHPPPATSPAPVRAPTTQVPLPGPGPVPSPAPLAPRRPATDGAYVVGPTLEPRLSAEDASRKAGSKVGKPKDVVLELVPHHVFSYRAVVAGGQIRRDEEGEVWVSAVSGKSFSPPQDARRVEELAQGFTRVRGLIAQADAAKALTADLTKALTKRESFERDFGETRLVERIQVAPVPGSLELRPGGEVLVPRWRIDGLNTVVYVDAVSGDLVT